MYRDSSRRLDLDGTIQFLTQTSKLVENYTTRSPITSSEDPRLEANEEILQWFFNWNESKIHPKAFISPQSFEDLTSMIRGTSSYVKMRMLQNGGSAIYLRRLNSDIIENIFSSQRGVLNGCNTNPTVLEYGKNLNAIVIAQNSVSLKQNACPDSAAVGGAQPFKILAGKTFRRGGLP